MSEKRYSVQSGYVVDLVTGNLLNCHDTRNLLNTQAAEIAGLRETVEGFRKAARMVQIDIGSKALRDYDRIPIFVSSLGALMDAMSSLPNPSEIPNSSFDPLDEHTLSQADADALKKMLEDGTAKARFPLTGHGITEVSDAAEGG